MSIKIRTLLLMRTPSILWFVFSIVLLSSFAGVPFTQSVVHASLMGTPQTSPDNSNPLRSDVNGDGVVNIIDLFTVAQAWNSCPGHLEWNPVHDLNDDDVVNILDMVLVVKDFGMKWVRHDFDARALVAYGVSSPLSQDLAAYMAKFDLINTDFRIGPDVEKIKAKNPDIIILGYKDAIAMNELMDDWDIVNQHEDWFLHDLNGDRLVSGGGGWFCMDISSQGWRQHYADYVEERIDLYGFDGVFADDVWTHLFLDAWTVPAELVPDWDYKVNGYTYWQTQMRELLSYVKSRIGNKLLIYNSPSSIYIDVADGKMRENFAFHDIEWRNPIDDINDLAEISSTGKYYLASPYAIPEDTEENFRFAFCCFLLGVNGSNAHFSWKNIHAESQGHYPQMDFDFGNPIGSCYLVEGALYGRDFEHAKAFVNLSEAETYTVEAEGEFYTLKPKSGVILV